MIEEEEQVIEICRANLTEVLRSFRPSKADAHPAATSGREEAMRRAVTGGYAVVCEFTASRPEPGFHHVAVWPVAKDIMRQGLSGYVDTLKAKRVSSFGSVFFRLDVPLFERGVLAAHRVPGDVSDEQSEPEALPLSGDGRAAPRLERPGGPGSRLPFKW